MPTLCPPAKKFLASRTLERVRVRPVKRSDFEIQEMYKDYDRIGVKGVKDV